jgi:hypothetical protein
VRYFATLGNALVRDVIRHDDRFGSITTPSAGNRLVMGTDYLPRPYLMDNGKFGEGWPGAGPWFRWVQRKVSRYGAERCWGVVAPDVPFDAAGTLAESLPWLARIRALAVPAVFCAQDGAERPGMIPWDHLGPNGVLFLAGTTEWKISEAAADLTAEATARGLRTHMGRVNTERRLRIAESFGVASCDGTTMAKSPANITAMVDALDRLISQPPSTEFALFGQYGTPPAPIRVRPVAAVVERPPAVPDDMDPLW